MTKTAAATPNTMEIAGQPAVISFAPELGAFRGKFLGLSGYCDFVSDSIQGLKKRARSLCANILTIAAPPASSHTRARRKSKRSPCATRNRSANG